MIQTIRSSGSAHLKGKNYKKAMTKYELDELSNKKKFIEILNRVRDALIVISSIQKETN